ncbi:MAG: 5-dehydro-4-deoxy-D-glucuronate isomerase [Spirochaetales bacterium]|nr:5-dehydro-4-deoxy-D-glucuronate isomerase [Spirochaetales bacterium]
MALDIRYAHHPEDVKSYDTQALRREFLVQNLYTPDALNLTYTHVDRLVFGGAFPVNKSITLAGGKDFGTDQFLGRRELGIICIDGKGQVKVGKDTYDFARGDGLYVGMGSENPVFSGQGAKFFLVSAPAHQTYPTVFIPQSKSNPRKLGSPETVNVRTIYQYVHPAVCKSCQLVMGMTELETGSVWNTMPCHTHERRAEVYHYFGMAKDTRVFHLQGKPDETRHLVVANEEAIISPSWSIHSGVGTGSYTFIWAMAGENQDFDDMDMVAPGDLR